MFYVCPWVLEPPPPSLAVLCLDVQSLACTIPPLLWLRNTARRVERLEVQPPGMRDSHRRAPATKHQGGRGCRGAGTAPSRGPGPWVAGPVDLMGLLG